jgi:hypothetical protein
MGCKRAFRRKARQDVMQAQKVKTIVSDWDSIPGNANSQEAAGAMGD